MTANNPIYYSNLIKDDGSIDAAIASLNKLKETYESLAQVIKTHAKDIKDELSAVSSVTDEGRKSTSKAASDADRLANANRELEFALSEVGAQVIDLKVQTANANKENRLNKELINARTQSYNELEAKLKVLVSEFKKLTKEEILNTVEGEKKLKQIISLKTQLKEIDTLLKLTTKTTKLETAERTKSKAVITEEEKARRKLAKATSDENITLMGLMASVREANQVAKLNSIIAREAEGSYNRLSAQYSLNKIELNKMSQAQRENTAEGKRLVTQTHDIYQEMIRLQEATGKHTLSVGNYAKTWDGLGNSVNQIVREIPAAAVSLNTFFLAISNNVPIFVDEINRLREANKIAVKEGKATTNVFKAVFSSFFSWHSLIVVFLTVFALYGKEIFTWAGNMLKGARATDEAAESQKRFNDVMLKGSMDAQDELIRLKLLYNASQDHKRSLEERKDAASQLIDVYKPYFKNLNEEAILAGKASDAYISLASSIVKSAKARAAEDKFIENYKRILELQGERAEKLAEFTQGESTIVFSYKSPLAKIRKEINELVADNKRLLGFINVSDLLFGEDGGTSKTKKETDETLKLMRQHTDAIIDNFEDEFKRRRLEIETAYAREKEDLEAKLATDKNLTAEGRDAINGIIIEKQQKLNTDLQELENERIQFIYSQRDEILAAEEKVIDDKLLIAQEGSKEELELRIALLEKMRERELLHNKTLAEDIRQQDIDINNTYDALIMQENLDFLRESAMAQLEAKQEFDKSEFDLIKHTERQKTIFKLQQEKERWSKILELASIGVEKLSEIEIETIKNLIKAIDAEIESTRSGGLLDLLGLNLDSKQQQALKQATSIVVNNFREIAQAQLDAANAAVEAANIQVDAAKSVVDAEIEARNRGYAYNVTAAQKELAEARKVQTQKIKLQEEAVRRQQRLDSLTQASSLITASANLWQAFSGIPVLGPILAIGAIAAMWGSFALAKIRAKDLSKNDVTYGEGGYELLEGGSHASGNDIPIGTTKDGRRRRAEGGEMLAIVNRRSTSKYRRVLPDVINSLNRGTFERKYGSSYDTDLFGITTGGTLGDLTTLEKSVDEIKEQGKKKYYTDQNGNLVIVYKNLKTVINAN